MALSCSHDVPARLRSLSWCMNSQHSSYYLKFPSMSKIRESGSSQASGSTNCVVALLLWYVCLHQQIKAINFNCELKRSFCNILHPFAVKFNNLRQKVEPKALSPTYYPPHHAAHTKGLRVPAAETRGLCQHKPQRLCAAAPRESWSPKR